MPNDCLSITSGFCGSMCRNSAGGVNRFYIGNVADIDKSSLTYNAEGALTGMDIDSLFAYVPYVDSSNWAETINVSPENGTNYYEQVATLVMGANQQALRNIVRDLGAAANIIVIVRDNNDRMWLLGDPNGKRLTWLSGGDSNSGTAFGDRNGWNLQLTCRSPHPAIEVIPTASGTLEGSLADADAVCDGNVS